MKYFSNLNAGWATLIINSFYYEPSFITNVPMDILDAWEEYQNRGYCTLYLFDERDEIFITITRTDAFVIKDKKYIELVPSGSELNPNGFELLKGLVNDIINNIELWGNWVCVSEKNVQKNINALQKRAENLGLV